MILRINGAYCGNFQICSLNGYGETIVSPDSDDGTHFRRLYSHDEEEGDDDDVAL